MNNKYLFSDKALLYIAIVALLCNMVYWIFPFRPIVWRMMVLLCFVDVIVLRRRQLTGLEKSVLWFAVLNFVYFFFSIVFMLPDYGQIGNISVALLSLSFFTHMGQRRLLTNRFVFVVIILLIAGSILQYNYSKRMIFETYDLETAVNNFTTSFLMLLPLLMKVRNNVLKISGFVICLLYIIAGAKRGNIFAATIPTLLFTIIMVKRSERKSVLHIVFTIAIIIAAGTFLYNQFFSNEFLMHRMEQTAQGNTTGRNIIYRHAWMAWSESDNFLHLLLGYGFDGTIRHPLMNGMHAHNDWLEILVDYGLAGVCVYLFVFISFFKVILIENNPENRMILISVLSIWLFKTIYSMGFTEPNLSIMFIVVGAILGQRQTDTRSDTVIQNDVSDKDKYMSRKKEILLNVSDR